jgi:hypothetical protein
MDKEAIEILDGLKKQISLGSPAERLGWQILYNAKLYLQHGKAYQQITYVANASFILM